MTSGDSVNSTAAMNNFTDSFQRQGFMSMWIILYDGVYKQKYIEMNIQLPSFFNLHWDYQMTVKNNQTSSIQLKNIFTSVGSFEVGEILH